MALCVTSSTNPSVPAKAPAWAPPDCPDGAGKRALPGARPKWFEALATTTRPRAIPRPVRYAEMAGTRRRATRARPGRQTVHRCAEGAGPAGTWRRTRRALGQHCGADWHYSRLRPLARQLAPLARAVELARASGDACRPGPRPSSGSGYVTMHWETPKQPRSAACARRRRQPTPSATGRDRARVEAALRHAPMAACAGGRTLSGAIRAVAEPDPLSRPRPFSGQLGDHPGRPRAFQPGECRLRTGAGATRAAPRAVTRSVLSQYILTLLWQAAGPEAEAVGQRAETLAQRVESLYLLCMAIGLRCYAQWRRSRMPGARENPARHTNPRRPRPPAVPVALPRVPGEIAQSEGDVPAMRRAVGQALRRARQRITTVWPRPTGRWHVNRCAATRAAHGRGRPCRGRTGPRSDASRSRTRCQPARARRNRGPAPGTGRCSRRLRAGLHLADALGSAWHAEEARAVALRWQQNWARCLPPVRRCRSRCARRAVFRQDAQGTPMPAQVPGQAWVGNGDWSRLPPKMGLTSRAGRQVGLATFSTSGSPGRGLHLHRRGAGPLVGCDRGTATFAAAWGFAASPPYGDPQDPVGALVGSGSRVGAVPLLQTGHGVAFEHLEGSG